MSEKMSIWIIMILLMFFGQNLMAQQLIDQITYDEVKGYYVIEYHYKKDSTAQVYTGTLMPGDHVNPQIDAMVEKLNSGGYKYAYVVQNKKNAPQALYSFVLKISPSVNKIMSPNSRWDGAYIEEKSELSWVKTGGRIPGIKSGESVKGFSFRSFGIPALINSNSSNYIWDSFPGEEPVGRLETVVDSLLENRRYIIVKTIGPRKLPENINNTALLDTLQSYLSFSCDTTWIENQGTCRSLEAKLGNVERQLERGNEEAATGSLQAFLGELQALREEQLSSEAYGLLYYNGKFLLEKLEE